MDLTLISAAVVSAVVAFAAAGVFFTSRSRRKVDYMLDALEDNETNFRFREDRAVDRRFNRTLNRMKDIFAREKMLLSEQERYFGVMLDKVSTGILVADSRDGHVAYSNAAALRMLGISSISSLRQLKNISGELYDAFCGALCGNGAEVGVISDMSRRVLSLKPSVAEIGGRQMTIISFNDISDAMNGIESESWTKLVRVLTHEIMNTVTPIASLSEALVRYADDYGRGGTSGGGDSHDGGEVTSRRVPDLREGLETISSSSRGLLKFVGKYRSLMHVPDPVRKVVWLRDIVSHVLQLTGGQLSSAGTECRYVEKSEDIMLYADRDQISQIMVNLIRNAIQAGASEICISGEINPDGHVIVEVANNGDPVPEDKREDIFIPFYTTRPSGSGIGLSLSRQIMHRHNGSLFLARTGSVETVFSLVFR